MVSAWTIKLPADLTFRAVEASTWADFERLFESRGGPSYCWCMPYRATPDENRRLDRETRKAGMRARVMAGAPVGLLAYAGGESNRVVLDRAAFHVPTAQHVGRPWRRPRRRCVGLVAHLLLRTAAFPRLRLGVASAAGRDCLCPRAGRGGG